MSQYPFDPTGIASSNLITNEQHVVNGANYRDYYFLVPDFAPFFINSVILSLRDALNNVRVLREGEDFYYALPYIGATRSIGVPVYGAIALSNVIQSGTITMRYQTLGGDYVSNPVNVITRIAEMVYNPRIITWDSVMDKPTVFPPINHTVGLEDTTGMQSLVDALNNIANTIAAAPPKTIQINTTINQL